jgi:hypothetical protein
MVEKLRLKHLDTILGEQQDHASIMMDVLGYKNRWFNRKRVFVKYMRDCLEIVAQAQQIDPTKIEYSEECDIKKPKSIDSISYRAMLEIQSLTGNSSDKSMGEAITMIIATACYGANHKGDYDSESLLFKSFIHKVKNSPLLEMFGLYNWISDQVKESQDRWDRLFLEVYIEDEDYQLAGGNRMSQFNVINTIKSICQDFNVDYDAAWQMPYAVVQANSLSGATSGYIQTQMSRIKEEKMKRQRATS